MSQLGRVNGMAINASYAGTTNGIQIQDAVPSFNQAGVSLSLLIQTGDHSKKAENYEVFDEAGNLTTSVWFNPQDEGMLEFIIVSSVGQADAIAQTQIIENVAPGDLLNISACQRMPGFVGSNWEVLSAPKVAGSNKDAKKWTCNVRKSPGIAGQMAA